MEEIATNTDMISMSYIVATKNRLPFLKILEEQIFSKILPDEEIVVVDANSSDGSSEYLQHLFNSGIIHQYIREDDKNQAHGWNKAMLMARGKIIKKIIDDDVHDLCAIRRCANEMNNCPSIDLVISDVLHAHLTTEAKIIKRSRLNIFRKWKNKEVECFSFSDVSLLIKKDAISYLGLFDTQFVMMDWEYSLRCSFMQANIAYYTGCNSLAVDTPGNITSQTTKAVLKREGIIGRSKYNYPGDRSEISLYSEIKIAVGTILFSLTPKKHFPSVIPPQMELRNMYERFYQLLHSYNEKNTGEYFL